ncbi:MAG TPA: response regulator [Victivallales bacterium]|nr:response regulator [Victivallales bacterium]HRR06445.1 response regulator [Victivallales bacterium]HRR28054.1 response regulator [Victivallales bacterium]HRU00731.1 response regulator [Victivallales bacterium]
MKTEEKNLDLQVRIEKLLRAALSNISQAIYMLGDNPISKLLEDAEAACIEAKELNSSLIQSIPHQLETQRKLLDTAKIEYFSKFLNGKKILILEDEAFVAKMISSALERNNCTAVIVETETDAVEQYKLAMKKGQKFDAVILDLVIRGKIGGIECLQKLLKIDPSIKAILSSGYCEALSKEIKEKFVAILPKPYTYSELVTIIAKLFTSHDNSIKG